jgi:hypothetical protein
MSVRRFIACVAALASAAPAALTAQAQAQGAPVEPAIRQLTEVLKTAAAEAKADTTQAKPGRVRLTYQLDRRGDCRVRLTQRDRIWKAEHQLISEADLSSLSPEIDIWTNPKDGMIVVTAYTTSGRTEVAEWWDDEEEARQRDGLIFRAWYRSAAERIATPLAAAIRACGGRPQDDAARALVERRADSVSAAKRAQAGAQADSLRAVRARIPSPGRWVVDSTPAVKNRYQTWWAAVAANDTIVGKYEATRPVLQLYCGTKNRQVEVLVLLGQAADISVHSEQRGRNHYLVHRAVIMLGRDDQPMRVAAWLHDHKKDRVGPEEGAQLDEALADLVAARRYRFGVRLFDMKEPSYAVFELDGVAQHLTWLRERCDAKPA